MSKRYLVAGVGNTLRGDDGVGIKALAYLKNKLNNKDFDFFEFSTQSIDILNYIKQYLYTFIIDAADFGAPAGSVKGFYLEDLNSGTVKNRLSTHSLSLLDFLKLYKMLDIRNKVYVIGIQPNNLLLCNDLSSEVKASFPGVLNQITKILN
ncbi:MAG TPA: hydrogenase maturation protease [Candidatus Omnitrophica bacterium]|nr:hydrogenase maturation protease [Candidatus Omnitrophota bacterium]